MITAWINQICSGLENLKTDYFTFYRHCIHYFVFIFFIWLSHLAIVSLFTFIHLQLGHGLKIIDEWFFQNAWMLVSLSILMSLWITFHAISLWSERRQLLSPLLRSGWSGSRFSFYVVLFFLWPMVMIWGKPQLKAEAEFIKNIISFVGVFLLYFSNVFFLAAVNEVFPLKRKEKIAEIILFPIFFFMLIKFSFPYPGNWGVETLLFFIFSFFLYFFRGENWTHPTYFLIFFLCPVSALLGIDPMWKEGFSYGEFKNHLKFFDWFLILGLSLVYLIFRERRLSKGKSILKGIDGTQGELQ